MFTTTGAKTAKANGTKRFESSSNPATTSVLFSN